MSSSVVQSFFLRFGWLIITGFSVFLFGTTTLYFYYCTDATYNFLGAKPEVVFNVAWRTSFYIHITGGMIALLLGPFQFVKVFRTKFMKWHRTSGKIYLGAILFLGGPAGLFMAFYAEGGLISVIGFIVMATLWILFTYKAYETIRRKDIKAHRAFMTRSFALTFAAVTLRIWVPVASLVFNLPQNFVVESSAWVSWLPNLLVAEVLLLTISKRL